MPENVNCEFQHNHEVHKELNPIHKHEVQKELNPRTKLNVQPDYLYSRNFESHLTSKPVINF
ncbi:hypothetical protein NC653_029229 [Populus alba x Populus x berolinensis]|uniref:Uncharacterized protein n=1 Tax=Populus alba x Populus x berolinensis TaxID=444605 RepID=A0AAD6Q466_9ROSI|nr:hypothetical protein NC653_029229 [Populus alba x Populus x berolinensis]